jgi:Tripartite ATP-independent periplasmic transporter, DctM component
MSKPTPLDESVRNPEIGAKIGNWPPNGGQTPTHQARNKAGIGTARRHPRLRDCTRFLPAAGLHHSDDGPYILPPLKAVGFDLIWFGVVMTIMMEMGLIHPPVALNIFVIKNIAPEIPLSDIIWGTMPFLLLMFLAVALCCVFPGGVTWLPSVVMK